MNVTLHTAAETKLRDAAQELADVLRHYAADSELQTLDSRQRFRVAAAAALAKAGLP